MTSAFDTKFLVHAGVELVVVAGMTFYLNRKISAQQEVISQLIEKVTKLEEALVNHSQVIKAHDNVLRPSTGHSGGYERDEVEQKKSDVSPKLKSKQQPPAQKRTKKQNRREEEQKSKKPTRQKRPSVVSDNETEMEDADADDQTLDAMIESDVAKIKRDRKKCDGDECPVD